MAKTFWVNNLKVYQCDTRKSIGQLCADEAGKIIRDMLKQKPEISIMFAAAPSQNDVFSSLVGIKDIAWNRINAYHMDEYIGLDADAPQGFGNFLKARIFSKVAFKSVNYINCLAEDSEAEAKRYAELLDAIDIDVCFMGIGQNTHIAFNDPHVARFDDAVSAKVVELDELCRKQQVDDGCFENIAEVPKKAITVTVPKLVSAKEVFCIVPDITKAKAVRAMLLEDISERYPATILKRHHSARLYLDADSSSLAELK